MSDAVLHLDFANLHADNSSLGGWPASRAESV